jgi:hypothetical protein
MLLEEILKEIEKDSIIDITRLDTAGLDAPRLHGKWIRRLSEERIVARGLEVEIAEMVKQRQLYYMGKLPDEAYKAEPLHHKVLKQDLNIWMDSDKQLNALKNRLYTQTLKISAIESFLKELSQRSFHIRNTIEYIKYQQGI